MLMKEPDMTLSACRLSAFGERFDLLNTRSHLGEPFVLMLAKGF